jgi:hypothetical protein
MIFLWQKTSFALKIVNVSREDDSWRVLCGPSTRILLQRKFSAEVKFFTVLFYLLVDLIYSEFISL